jgi:hypothetical protein
MWLPYSAHHSHMAPTLESCSSHMVPFTSHMAPSGSHMTPIWHTGLQHGSHGSHMVPTRCIWLTYGTICLQYGAHSSHTVHPALRWSSYITCGSHIVPTDSHTVPAALVMAYATLVWCHPPSNWWNLAPIWLQSSAHGFQRAHTPPRWPLPPIWLPYRHVAPIPACSSHYCNCMY